MMIFLSLTLRLVACCVSRALYARRMLVARTFVGGRLRAVQEMKEQVNKEHDAKKAARDKRQEQHEKKKKDAALANFVKNTF